jgi:hypothetical protein
MPGPCQDPVEREYGGMPRAFACRSAMAARSLAKSSVSIMI